MLSQTTQDNGNCEQTPAAVFLHTAHAKQISLLCYRDYIVCDNETFVFNLKSMENGACLTSESLAGLAMLNLVKSAISIHMSTIKTVTSSITISP